MRLVEVDDGPPGVLRLHGLGRQLVDHDLVQGLHDVVKGVDHLSLQEEEPGDLSGMIF